MMTSNDKREIVLTGVVTIGLVTIILRSLDEVLMKVDEFLMWQRYSLITNS